MIKADVVKFVVLLRLTSLKVRDHLMPLLENPAVQEVILVRYVAPQWTHPKLRVVAAIKPDSEGQAEPKFWRSAFNSLKVLWLAWQTARQEKDAILYGIHLVPYGLYSGVIAKLLGRVWLVTMIGTDFNKDLLEYQARGFWQWFLRHAPAVTIFSDSARQILLKLGFAPERVWVVSHAIEMERYQRQTDAPQDFAAIYTGHLWALKETWRLVEAWKVVIEKHPQARLAIVGDGEMRETLIEQAQQLGLSEHVHFEAWTNDVVGWLSRARIFVNVSNQEGVPMAMLEAMACGLVPVVTAVGGVPDVIQDGVNGFLIEEPAQPSQIADRIITLLEDESCYKAMQQRALSIRERYGYSAVIAEWEPVLAHLRRASLRP